MTGCSCIDWPCIRLRRMSVRRRLNRIWPIAITFSSGRPHRKASQRRRALTATRPGRSKRRVARIAGDVATTQSGATADLPIESGRHAAWQLRFTSSHNRHFEIRYATYVVRTRTDFQLRRRVRLRPSVFHRKAFYRGRGEQCHAQIAVSVTACSMSAEACGPPEQMSQAPMRHRYRF